MSQFKTIIPLVALFILISGFAVSIEWTLFETSDFSALYPRKPESRTDQYPSEMGELTMSTYIYTAADTDPSDENLVYGVSTTNYPEMYTNEMTNERLADFYKSSIEGAVTNVNGKLISDKDIELEGVAGKEIKIDYRDGLALIRMRIFLVKSRAYIVQTITMAGKDNNGSIDKFMNSFKLKK